MDRMPQTTGHLLGLSQQLTAGFPAEPEVAAATTAEKAMRTVIMDMTGSTSGTETNHETAAYFLQRRSQTHSKPFYALSELIENATHSSVNAKQLWIDVAEIKKEICLTFTDNGNGMTPLQLERMLSFWPTNKAARANHQPSGEYGYGFKSGSMRLGKDIIVFTKNGGALSVGLLSQTFLEQTEQEDITVPIVTFSQQNKKRINTEDSLLKLDAILRHSLFKTEEEVLASFDAIPSKKGTRIVIWNIQRRLDGRPELDFDADIYDIQIRSHRKQHFVYSIRPGPMVQDLDRSFREFCSLLYLRPRMQIYLRQKKVKCRLMSKTLANMKYDTYKPSFSNKQIRVIFGMNSLNKDYYGVMMYHNNRLIKAYEKVGCQLRRIAPVGGIGVIGVVECNFLDPTRNRMDFKNCNEYRLTMAALGLKLNHYCKERLLFWIKDTLPWEIEVPGPTWVQCDECLKWRKLPSSVPAESLPDKWVCVLHPNIRYRSCVVPEEQEPMEGKLCTKNLKKKHSLKNPTAPKQRKLSSVSERSQVFPNPVEPFQTMCIKDACNGIADTSIERQEAVPPPTKFCVLPPPSHLEKPRANFHINGAFVKNQTQSHAPSTSEKRKITNECDMIHNSWMNY